MYKNLEEYSLNAWPALQSFVHDGWLLRFAAGYTKRSNSINPIYAGESKKVLDKIEYCESIYSSMNLDTIFKITPFVTAKKIDKILEDMQYVMVEPSSVKILNLSRIEEPEHNHVTISPEFTDEWGHILAGFNNLSATTIEITKQILSTSFLTKGFFTLYDGDIPVACGVGVIEQNYVGLFDIITGHQYRNRGYGKLIVLHILKWARMNGATLSYLQVVKSNESAIKLYKKLGYREAYTYWYRYKKLSLEG
jgi:GNAT superfamily N-acetyltransferase